MTKQKKKQNCKHITKKMAMEMAEDIKIYWAAQGQAVHVWVERITFGKNARDYMVRSDMYNGLPISNF